MKIPRKTEEKFVESEEQIESQGIAPCPCCGFLTMTGPTRGTFDICPICDWEDDDVQYDDPDYEGGANQESLNQARANYAKFGAKNTRALSEVRPPLPDEIPPMEESTGEVVGSEKLMDLQTKIEELINRAKKHLSPADIRQVQRSFESGEPELAIGFICEKSIKCTIFFPKSFGDLVKDIASNFNLPSKGSKWGITFESQRTHHLYNLYVGKSPASIEQELKWLFSDIWHKFNKESFEAIKEYIIVGEKELAIDAICTGLSDGKIPITKKNLARISTTLIDTGSSLGNWEGLIVEEADELRPVHESTAQLITDIQKNSRTRFFPETWGEKTIIDNVNNVARDWESIWTKAPDRHSKSGPSRYYAIGSRAGIRIKVVIEPKGEGILTAYPIQCFTWV